MDRLPAWLAALDDEDVGFLRRFLLCTGSLKELAEMVKEMTNDKD